MSNDAAAAEGGARVRSASDLLSATALSNATHMRPLLLAHLSAQLDHASSAAASSAAAEAVRRVAVEAELADTRAAVRTLQAQLRTARMAAGEAAAKARALVAGQTAALRDRIAALEREVAGKERALRTARARDGAGRRWARDV